MTTLADRKLSRRLKLMIIGPYKSAKTVNAHKLPRTRTLDFDDGMQSVAWAIKTGVIDKTPEEIIFETIGEEKVRKGLVTKATAFDLGTDAVDKWLAEEKDNPVKYGFDTIIVDSGTALTDFSINKGLDENKRFKLSHSKDKQSTSGFRIMMIQDWGSAMVLFKQFINYLLELDRNVVLICHDKSVTDSEGNEVAIMPALIGDLKNDVPRLFDEVWYSTVEGTRNKPEFKIQTKPDAKRRLGSRLGCLDPVEDWDFYAIRDKVAKFYGVKAEELWTPGPR